MAKLYTTLSLFITVCLISFSASAGGEYRGQCPSPDQIKQHTIPSSINCAYSAESDGVEYGGYNNCGLLGLPFVGARISEINGYWSLYCNYANPGLNNTMSVGPDPQIKSCQFKGGAMTCSGTLEECQFTCASRPNSSQEVPPN